MVRRGKPLVLLLALAFGALAVGAAWADNTERVLIRAGKPYTQLRAQIAGLGGRVTHEYKYVDAVAAEVPAGALAALAGMVGDSAISKDVVIPNPAPVNTLAGRPGFSDRGPIEEESYASVEEIDATGLQRIAAANPDAYLINNGIMGTSALHALGRYGQGVTVGVIDTGIRPGFPHISLDGSVVGCENSCATGWAAATPPTTVTAPSWRG